MGILDDTLSDASRPLPAYTLRRAAAGEPVPDSVPDAAPDDGEAMTIYRLQKSGAPIAPQAPPAPRAVEAGAPAASPFHAPVGNFIDASHQFVTSMDGLETGKGQESTRNSNATDKQQPTDSPDTLLRLEYDDATGYSNSSRRDPSPLDDFGNSAQRKDSSDGMRRATGRGAASGDPPGGPRQRAMTLPAVGDGGPRPIRPARRRDDAVSPPPAPTAPADDRSLAGGSSGDPSGPAQAPAGSHSLPIDSHAVARGAAGSALAGDPLRPQREQPPTSSGRSDVQPRLSIGRIEVTVLSEPKPAARIAPSKTADDAFLSKHYLRRL